MLRQKTVTFLLATSVAVASACGGGSKSSDTETMPVASSPEAPIGTTHETVHSETGTEPGLETGAMPDEGRQNVSGTTTGMGVGTGGQPGTTPESGSDPAMGGTQVGGTGTGLGADTQAALGAPAIFAMLGAANEHEIATAKLAAEKSKNASVKKYAKSVVDHHTQMQKNADKLAGKISVSPEPNADVESLRSESSAALERLRALEGAEFDRAFIDQMVQDHEKVLSLIDERMKPAATDQPDLVSMLDKDRTKIQSHLDEARKLQTRLNR
jgi:putative membrane protein